MVGYHATKIIFQNSKKNAVGYHATNFRFKKFKKYYSHNYINKLIACLVGCHANSLIFLYIFRFVMLY